MDAIGRSGLPPWESSMSDGCSVPSLLRPFFPLTPEQRQACVRHDEKYYYGGTKADRLIADATLMIEWVLADMDVVQAEHGFQAVRAGGGPGGRKRYSWAFGGQRFVYDLSKGST